MSSMEDQIKRLNAQYGFALSEEEIKLVARQAEEINRMFEPLFEVDLNNIMPAMKISHKRAKK
jgi:Asp-tRNA(Asn)/Glu-tRNA(Gln) amidotransferase C subunit